MEERKGENLLAGWEHVRLTHEQAVAYTRAFFQAHKHTHSYRSAPTLISRNYRERALHVYPLTPHQFPGFFRVSLLCDGLFQFPILPLLTTDPPPQPPFLSPFSPPHQQFLASWKVNCWTTKPAKAH